MAVKKAPSPLAAGLLPPTDRVSGTVKVLMETAVLLFAQRGYHGVSVRDITGQVGIKPASMYAHYPSKGHLLVELMRLGHEQLVDRVDEALAQLGADATPTEQLRTIVRAHVRAHAEYPLLARVCTNELHGLSGEAMNDVLGLRVQLISQISTVLEAGVEAGELDVDDVFLTTMAIAGMSIRVANWYGGNESGMEFGPVLRPDATPAARYAIDEVADAYAAMALRLVS